MTARERLVAYLKRSKLNQAELAEAIGMNYTHLSKILCGHRPPGLATAAKIERQTGIPAISWLDRRCSRVDRPKKSTGSKQLVGNGITDHVAS